MFVEKDIDDILDLWGLNAVFGDFVCISYRWGINSKTNRPNWSDSILQFTPDLKTKLINRFKFQSPDQYDIYWSLGVFSDSYRKQEYIRPSQYLWADGDNGDRNKLPPTYSWDTSPGRWSGVWLLDEHVEPNELLNLNKRLAAYIGADPSGFDLTQVLRVPGTKNHKYDNVPDVGHMIEGPFYRVGELAEILPHLKIQSSIKGANFEAVPINSKVTRSMIIRKYIESLSYEKLDTLLNRNPVQGSRSSFLYGFHMHCLNIGMIPEEIFVLERGTPWHLTKFGSDQKLWDDINRAVQKRSDSNDN